MSTAVVAIEGVLSDSPVFEIAMQPTPIARVFYYTLANSYRLVVVTDEVEHSKVMHWLRSNGFHGFGQVLNGVPEALDPAANRMGQLRALRSSRTAVELVIDSNPAVVAYAASVGITGLLWTPARRGAERTDLQPAAIRSWEEMVPPDPRIPGGDA